MIAWFSFFLLSLLFNNNVHAAYQPDGHNIALYWGAGGGQKSLGYYCKSGAADIMMISFLNNWNADSCSFNFGNACGASPGPCTQIEEDIKTCQSLGIKVLLSFGGDDRRGKYGLKNDLQGESLAEVFYNMFHPNGNATVKPFGTAEIDGIDFDIENGNDNGLAALVTKLRSLWTTKTLLVSACPQCPYPDGNVLNLLKDKNAKVDLAFIQYYNNACGINHASKFKKNWKVWENFQQTLAGNSNLKLYIGMSASSGSGYTKPAAYVNETSADARTFGNFGGFFLWDAASGFTNVDKTTGLNQIYGIRNIIRDEVVTSSVITSSATSTSLSTFVSSATETLVSTSTSILTVSTTEYTRVTETSTVTSTSGQSTEKFTVLLAHGTNVPTVFVSTDLAESTEVTVVQSTSISTSLSASATTTTTTYLSEISTSTASSSSSSLIANAKRMAPTTSESSSVMATKTSLSTVLTTNAAGAQAKRVITIVSTIAIPQSLH
ncbi:hypothetical protein DASC09_024210 [Saccharomycopsis crataegensis]|uniref:chitinase n=1 Tax=Saccharomycopsis crataegensis TaxID=43959 RepID=A0AAV5QK81_9ASCO|nr:hypothetical protein DASC09_024210 [Saccharomycopsis crataegensis]